MDLSSDIRGLLQYVPEFRGHTFVVDLDWPDADDALKAEVLMDLTALQKVGVKLVISLRAEQAANFYDYSTELEFRVSAQVREPSFIEVSDIVERGQAVLVKRDGDLISDELIELSVGLRAKKLIVVSRDASLKKSGEVVTFLHVSKFTDTVAKSALLERAKVACMGGIARVHLLDILQPGVIVNELFSAEGVGTMVYNDSYRKLRKLTEEDIPEMLSMIGRSVRNTHLVPRTYEDVKENINAYYVMEVDDNVVGCGALYEYEDCAEIACLYVKQTHENTGYGAEIVKFLEKEARSKKIKSVFALSNRAAYFFMDVLGYKELSIHLLPEERKMRLLESGRESRAFTKALDFH